MQMVNLLQKNLKIAKMLLLWFFATLFFQATNNAFAAKAYIVIVDGAVVAERNADIVYPIASLTKIYTVERSMLLPDEDILITRKMWDEGKSFRSKLIVGKKYSRRLLERLAMVSSDNVASIAIWDGKPVVEGKTLLVDASGLSRSNVSTARDIAMKSILHAKSSVGEISVAPYVTMQNGISKNTNPLVKEEKIHFLLSKTGWTFAAGGCLTVVFKHKESIATVVILGSSSVRSRWADFKNIKSKYLEY